MNINEQYQRVSTWPRKQGRAYLLSHLKGDHLPLLQAVHAKCYECCGGEGHGSICTVTTCPLLPYSPYNGEPIKKATTATTTTRKKGTKKK